MKLDSLTAIPTMRAPQPEAQSFQNVHVNKKNTKGEKRGSGVDFGANTKTAFQIIADGMAQLFGENDITANYSKQLLSYPTPTGRKVLGVKTGCSVLGNMNLSGQWEILPGIDYILYAPDLNNDSSIEGQLRIFTKEEFLKMWEDLNLIRRKVSAAAKKRYEKRYGPDFKCNTAEHADVISVQSFMNSGRKSVAVLEACRKFPSLASVGYTYFEKC